MPIFKIYGQEATTQKQKIFFYDTDISRIYHENGEDVMQGVLKQDAPKTKASLQKGKTNLEVIKIQLGLSCNFECEYCSQRFVPHSDETNPNDVDNFVEKMSTWFDGGKNGDGTGVKFEYWGGEPFVYWKTMKPLAEQIAAKYPNSTPSVITNGSLLDNEKIDWLEKYNFQVSLSHDGPGQPVRGPDPLDDYKSKQAIIELFKRFATKGKMSINPMVNAKNTSKEAISKFFEDFVKENIGEEYLQYLVFGEGGFVDAYDEGGMENSLLDEEQDLAYRYKSYIEVRDSKAKRFIQLNQKVHNFIRSIELGKNLNTLGQKCSMDKSSNIAVDLNGNVLTCQNVSAISSNPAGISHKLGTVDDLDSVIINSGTHWSDREECPKCPIIHICQGACLFLTGELWEASCNNAFSDSIALFANAFEVITGHIPIYIEGEQRKDRQDIFWWIHGKPENLRKPKKVISIKAIN
jgi:uncharacterized protein